MGTYRCGRDQRGLAMRVVDEVLADARVDARMQPTAAMRERQAWVLKQMHNLGGVAYLGPG